MVEPVELADTFRRVVVVSELVPLAAGAVTFLDIVVPLMNALEGIPIAAAHRVLPRWARPDVFIALDSIYSPSRNFPSG
jgi:hypothetical protein